MACGWSGRSAQGSIQVAVLGAPATATWNTDVQSKLIATGQFSTVDAFLVNTFTPSLAQLQNYDAVLVYSDTGFANPTALGNVLADYVDGGGGVVTSVFANASVPIAGRWNSDNYWALQPAGQVQGVQLTLGTVSDPLHPVMDGVSTFNGGTSSYRSTGTVNPSASVIAEWSNGAPLVLERTIGGNPRIDLNFYPPSDASRSDFWLASTDGDLLMANALTYVAGEQIEAAPEPATIVVWSLLLLTGAAVSFKRRAAIAA